MEVDSDAGLYAPADLTRGNAGLERVETLYLRLYVGFPSNDTNPRFPLAAVLLRSERIDSTLRHVRLLDRRIFLLGVGH